MSDGAPVKRLGVDLTDNEYHAPTLFIRLLQELQTC